MGHSFPRKIAHRPEGQPHQAGKEKGREGQDAVNHFLLGHQMHEITRNEESFGAGDHQRQADIHRPMIKMNKGGPNREDGAGDQGPKDVEVTAYVMAEVIVGL